MKKEVPIFLLRCLKITILSCALASLFYTISHVKEHTLYSAKRSITESYTNPDNTNDELIRSSQEVFFGDDADVDDILYKNKNDNIISGYNTDNLYLEEDYSTLTVKEDFNDLINLYTQNIHKSSKLNQVTTDMQEKSEKEVITSKMFSTAMGRSEVTPFYLKSTENFKKDDITITTLVTGNRIRLLSRLATRYKGPISAAIHINVNEQKEQFLEKLQQLFDENIDMKNYVDVHLIVDKYNRQFNMWRNIAKLYARTDYVAMLDIDFYVCTDFRSSVRKNAQMMNLLKSGKGALVIPAFEYTSQSDGREFNTFPNNKQELIKLINVGKKIDMFHRTWKKGHFATNYKKWYRSSTLYKVTKYGHSYEPYVIFKKESTPWCDERFIGYGANKAACLYEMYLSGISYYVLPNDFIIHQTHKYPERTRRKERLFNKKMYANYREELCLRYARKFVADGVWNRPLSKNLKNECKKIRGIRNDIKNINK